MDSRSAEQWDRHWSELSRTNALNPAQTWRGDLIMDLLAATEPSAPFRVLDIGCGSGELCAHLGTLRADAEVVGLDISEAALTLARQKVPAGRFRQCDLTRAVAIPGLSHWATHAV